MFFFLEKAFGYEIFSPITSQKGYDKVTPFVVRDKHEVSEFDNPKIVWNPRNDLRRGMGSVFLAKGEPLILEGNVYDVNGVPVDGVRIKILQNNFYGFRNFEKKGTPMYDKNFNSTGIATTDNSGYYRFYTIFPTEKTGEAPTIKMLLLNEKYQIRHEFEMFFTNHPKNKDDKLYKTLTIGDKDLLSARVFLKDDQNRQLGKIAIFNITINTIQPYKGVI